MSLDVLARPGLVTVLAALVGLVSSYLLLGATWIAFGLLGLWGAAASLIIGGTLLLHRCPGRLAVRSFVLAAATVSLVAGVFASYFEFSSGLDFD